MKMCCLGDIHWEALDADQLKKEFELIFWPYLEANKDSLDLIFISGDYFDRKMYMNSKAARYAIETMYRIVSFSQDNGIKVRMTQGTRTHDMNQTELFRPYEATHPCFKLYNTVDVEELFPDVFVLFIPEEYPLDADEYYGELLEEISGQEYDWILGHGTIEFQSFTGQQQESERTVKSAPVFNQKNLSNVTLGGVVFGHIHTRAAYREKVFYHGSFSRTAFGEQGSKGFLEITYDLENREIAEYQYIDNTAALRYDTVRYEDIVSEIGQSDDKAVAEYIEDQLANEVFKFRLLIEENSDGSGEALERVFRKYFAANSKFETKIIRTKREKLVISETQDSEILETDEEVEDKVDPLAFVLGDDDPVEIVQKFIEIQEGVELDIDDIRDAISE